ncbi:ABC transporter, ATP-binding protein, partial [mine drainage metagenome]
MIEARSAAFRYGARVVLEGISMRLEEPSVVALCGPNGSGKSTLLHVLAGIYPAQAGDVLLDGTDVLSMRPAQRARRIAVVPQYTTVGFDLTVEDYCALGRLHRADFLDRLLWRPLGGEDAAAVESALSRLSLTGLRTRRISRLSGGERARAAVALALAQGADHLLLDEPTAHLDPAFSRELLVILQGLAESGIRILIVLHDLTLAGLYA